MSMTVAPMFAPPSAEVLAQAALGYARAGLNVFPVKPDKAPFTEHGMKEATSDIDQVVEWWRQWPHALIGCRVPEDVVILDIDTRHGGMDTWKALRANHDKPIPPTRAHHSGRNDGGGHIWFRRPPGKLSAAPLHQWAKDHGTGHAAGKHSWRAGIDLLVYGHRYTILPPSPHPATGKPYQWKDGHGPEMEPAEMPSWLVEIITQKPKVVTDFRPVQAPDVDSIADWFSDHYSWRDILEPEGWTVVKGNGDEDGSAWRHPNATATLSATIKHHQLFVYSTNTDFEPTEEGSPSGYTPFRAWATLAHKGDMSAAAREARSWHQSDGEWDLPAVLTSGVGGDGDARPQPQPDVDGLVPVNWADLFGREHKGESWLLRPVVAEGRQAAVWAVHKTGKSLFSLDVAVRTALGRPYATDESSDPTNVIYLDMEMTEDDLQERMSDYGYGPEDADLLQERLHYYLLPNLPPLDTPAGAIVLCDLVERHAARLVVLDTMSRVVDGEENSADTYRDFYRHSGAALKRRGVSLLRLDHAGKDPSKGQRGSSSKGDDVDVIFELRRTENGYTLVTTATRMGWVPPRSAFVLTENPFLSLAWTGQTAGWPAGTKELADTLDDLAGAAELSNSAARELLRKNGVKVRNTVIAAALKYRIEQWSEVPRKAPK